MKKIGIILMLVGLCVTLNGCKKKTVDFITIDELREKINNKEEFAIYYSWNICGDCADLDTKFLKSYLEENRIKKNFFFKIEVANWRDDGSDTDKWKEFAKEFNFDTYRGGKVPTVQYYKDGELKDMMVYYNDVLTYDLDKMVATITESFYPDFIGKEYVIDEVLTNDDGSKIGKSSAYRLDKLVIHNEKAKLFFDKYIKK